MHAAKEKDPNEFKLKYLNSLKVDQTKNKEEKF